MLKTAVVILNWNGLNFLKQFLGIVIRYSSGKDSEIFIIDNNSTDGSCEWIINNFPEISVIKLDKNHGFAGGYNIGLQNIKAKYFLLLNSDIQVTEGWMNPLINFMDTNPDVASCQPKILSYINKNYFEYAGAAGGYIDKFGYPCCRGRILTYTEKDTGQYDSYTDIFWSSGAAMLIRSDAWDKCGGFDYDFFAHMEEIDLCWRLHNLGYRISFIPDSVVYHVGGGALPYNSPFKTYLNFRNSLYLLYKNLPARKFRQKMFIRLLLDGVAAAFFLVKMQFRSVAAVWNAHMDFYRNLHLLKSKRTLLMKSNTKLPDTVLNKIIVFEFYIKQNKTYYSLKINF